MALKPQDILVALKLAILNGKQWSFPSLSTSLDISVGEVHKSIQRLTAAHLYNAATRAPIRAALEEFLRTWIEQENLMMAQTKKSIDSYAKILKEADLINKQDHKDIISWAGLRNSASHEYWQDVEDRNKIE